MEHKSNMCLILCGEIYMLNLDDALLFEADDHYTAPMGRWSYSMYRNQRSKA